MRALGVRGPLTEGELDEWSELFLLRLRLVRALSISQTGGTPQFALYGEILSLRVPTVSSRSPRRKALSMLKVGSGSWGRPGDRMPIRRVRSGCCARRKRLSCR